MGGRTFAWLHDFVAAIGRDVFNVAAEFDGIYEVLTRLACNVDAGASQKSRLVGAGNGIRRNPVLRAELESTFVLPMQVPAHTEEAAFGAAPLASVSVGERRSLAEVLAAIE